MKNFIICFIIISVSYAQTYCAGDQISISDQNLEHAVGAAMDGYEIGDSFKLADYNGDLNGGDYHIIFIDMSASWWGPCQSNAPIVDGLEEQWADYGVKFITSLSDAGSPYTCESWQSSFGESDAPLVLDENQSSTGFFDLLHDSWNAFPTFVIIDHTMTVRAKPWTLDSNTNSNPCDGSNNTINGWSGGDTNDFLQQLVDECGQLCEGCSGTVDSDGDGLADECDDCHNMPGDVNDDLGIDVLDIVLTVNTILSIGETSECASTDSDIDGNGTINILDVIQIINIVIG